MIWLNEDGKIKQKRIDLLDKLDNRKVLEFYIENLDSNFNDTLYSDIYLHKKYIINNGLLPFYYFATLLPYIRFKNSDICVQISRSDEEVARQNTNILTLAKNIKNNPYQHIIEKCKK